MRIEMKTTRRPGALLSRFAAGAVLTGALLFSSHAAAEENGGPVLNSFGNVEISHSTDSGWRTADEMEPVTEGTAIRTGEDSQALIVWRDGGVRIGPAAFLVVEKIPDEESSGFVFTLSRGSARALAGEGPGASAVRVRTLKAAAGARGAEFYAAAASDGGMRAVALTGVATIAAGDTILFLQQGMETLAGGDGFLLEPAAMSEEIREAAEALSRTPEGGEAEETAGVTPALEPGVAVIEAPDKPYDIAPIDGLDELLYPRTVEIPQRPAVESTPPLEPVTRETGDALANDGTDETLQNELLNGHERLLTGGLELIISVPAD